MISPSPFTYKIAALLYAFDAKGRVLLLHRIKPPNKHLYSPPGGKLEQDLGESPTQCAQREMHEETGIDLPLDRFMLSGIVSERGFGGDTHWMMYLYEVTGTIDVADGTIAPGEGELRWYTREEIDALDLPMTDKEVIWPLFWKYRQTFFMAHIDCHGEKGETLTWQLEQPIS